LQENHNKQEVIDDSLTDHELDDLLFSVSAKSHSSVHWTPIKIAKQAAKWLAPSAGIKVLDIGSGVGKFCIVGALHTEGYFTGVEHRSQLINQAKKALKKASVFNVEFLLADMISIDFTKFDSFYFFNPFYENLVPNLAIDAEIELSGQKYYTYLTHVYHQLETLKTGTRVATYCANDAKIPTSYELVFSTPENNSLRFWIKR
jgi:cyclopropane fatty-acyl-phospholipid synthase-like methyltransferase